MANEKSKLFIQNMPDTQVLPETTYEQLTDMPQDLNEGDVLIYKNGKWEVTPATSLKTRVTVGQTTTGAAGALAQVYNSGTALEPVLNFVVPQGIQGAQGNRGATGDRGPQGFAGKDGLTITEITSTPKEPDPAYPNQTLTEVTVSYNNETNDKFNVYARDGEAFGHYRGNFILGTTAEVRKDDIFTWQGSTWIALRDQLTNPGAPHLSGYWNFIAKKGVDGAVGLEALTVDTAVTTSAMQGGQVATIALSHFNRTPVAYDVFITNDVQTDGVYIATFVVTSVSDTTVDVERIQANKISAATEKKYQHNISWYIYDERGSTIRSKINISFINTNGTKYTNSNWLEIAKYLHSITNGAEYPINGYFEITPSAAGDYEMGLYEAYSIKCKDTDGNFTIYGGLFTTGVSAEFNISSTALNFMDINDTVIEI